MDADTALTQLRAHATEAARHARCGPRSACRRDALAKVDQDLDTILALPRLRDMGASAVTGAGVL